MKRIIAAVLAVVMLFGLVACGGSKLTGKWAFGVNTYEFSEDGKATISINGVLNFDGTYTVSGDKLTLEVSGLTGSQTVELTYKVKGDKLTLSGNAMFSGVNTDLTLERVSE